MTHKEHRIRIGKEWFIIVPLGLMAIAFFVAFSVLNLALKSSGGGGGGGGHKPSGGGHKPSGSSHRHH